MSKYNIIVFYLTFCDLKASVLEYANKSLCQHLSEFRLEFIGTYCVLTYFEILHVVPVQLLHAMHCLLSYYNSVLLKQICSCFSHYLCFNYHEHGWSFFKIKNIFLYLCMWNIHCIGTLICNVEAENGWLGQYGKTWSSLLV